MSPGVIQYIGFGEMRPQIGWRKGFQKCARSQVKIKFLPQWPSRLKTRDLALNLRKQEANMNTVRREYSGAEGPQNL